MVLVYLSTSGHMGGAETALLALLHALAGQEPQWTIVLLLGQDGPLAAEAVRLGLQVRLVPMPPALARVGAGTRVTDMAHPRGARALLDLLRHRRQLLHVLRAYQPDVVHSNGLKMHMLLASFGKRALSRRSVRVCHLHDGLSARPAARWLFRLLGRRFNAMVASSQSVTRQLEALRRPSSRVCCIPNGVTLSRFQPEAAHGAGNAAAGSDGLQDTLSEWPQAPAGAVRIALVGTFARWKGHHIFMRALAKLPPALNVCAYVVGGAIYQTDRSQYTREQLQAAAHALCPRVELVFTGVISRMEEAYPYLDIVVHASTQPEPFGMVLVEAMASGRAVIASRGGAVAEIVDDEVNGLLYPAGDDLALAAQMERLVRDPALRLRLARAGLATARSRFSAALMAQRFAQLYRRLVAEARPKASRGTA